MNGRTRDRNRTRKSLFELGATVATPGALGCLENCGVNAGELLSRHQSGDWGTIPAEDADENRIALEQGLRIISSYPMRSGERIWIITEADRSVTTLLLPQEY
jgi:hypothetical protein